jgi:diacylglycerol kinase
MVAIEWILDRVKSFGYAFAGIATLLHAQQNARIHAVAVIVVVAAGWHCQLSGVEWGLVILAMGLVTSAEAMNTALEILCDRVEPEQHPAIKQVKDVAAAAVLLAAIAAAAIGALVFVPKILL